MYTNISQSSGPCADRSGFLLLEGGSGAPADVAGMHPFPKRNFWTTGAPVFQSTRLSFRKAPEEFDDIELPEVCVDSVRQMQVLLRSLRAL